MLEQLQTFIQQLDPISVLVGALLLGLPLLAIALWLNSRRFRLGGESRQSEIDGLQQALKELRRQSEELTGANHDQATSIARLETLREALTQQLADSQQRLEIRGGQRDEFQKQVGELERSNTELGTRLQEQAKQHGQQLETLQEAETRLSDAFQRLAQKIFDDKSKRFSEQNQQNMDALLKPLNTQLSEFNRLVNDTHKQETAQHKLLEQRLTDLQGLNQRLHDDAAQLTRALTSSVKLQGSWGEQQLERLLQLAGLQRGREYATQYSVKSESRQRLQPDVVLFLPEGKTIIMDSKVSLTAWVRYQAAENDEDRGEAMAEHLRSLRTHINGLAERRYSEVEELNALDFVLMFVPIEAALIEALNADAELINHALERRIALLSPTNLLATLRTVASVWQIHKQNSNAREIARRAGRLYDKFIGFTTSLKEVGDKLKKAQESYDKASSQLASGSGNLVRQTEMLKRLGARSGKAIDERLLEKALESELESDLESSEEAEITDQSEGQD